MPSGWRLPQFATGGIAGVIPQFASGGIVGGFSGFDRTLLPQDYGQKSGNNSAEQSSRMTQMIARQVQDVSRRNRTESTGGGRTINVTSNLTVNMTGGSRADADQAREMEGRVKAQVKSALVEALVDEKRPGGVLYRGSVR